MMRQVRAEEEKKMKIYETKDYQEMSRQAANILSAQVILKAGLCTGSGNRFYTDRNIRSVSRLV